MISEKFDKGEFNIGKTRSLNKRREGSSPKT